MFACCLLIKSLTRRKRSNDLLPVWFNNPVMLGADGLVVIMFAIPNDHFCAFLFAKVLKV